MRVPTIGLTFLALLTTFVETPKSLNWITPLGVPQALAQTSVHWQVETNPLVLQGIKRTQISQLPSVEVDHPTCDLVNHCLLVPLEFSAITVPVF